MTTSPTPEPTPEPTAEPSAAAGIERLCEAFDIVNDEVSPAFDELSTSGMGEADFASAALAIVTAGADIEDLAEGVPPSDLGDEIRELGQLYQEMGEAVGEGDLFDDEATDRYLDLVVEHAQSC